MMFRIGQKFELDKNVIPLKMLWIPPGRFTLGKHNDSKSRFTVEEDDVYLPVDESFETTIPNGFWLGECLIKQTHWQRYGKDSEKVWETAQKLGLSLEKGANLPMLGISWLEAMYFCRHLNISNKSQLPEGYHFSLPTEAQWEYACKIEQEVRKCNDSDNLQDMLDVTREWCFDIAAYYPSDNVPNWMGNKDEDDWFEDKRYRIIRGINQSVYRECRSAYAGLSTIAPIVSFRVCLRPITEWDLNDPLLQKEGINILG